MSAFKTVNEVAAGRIAVAIKEISASKKILWTLHWKNRKGAERYPHSHICRSQEVKIANMNKILI